MAMGVAGGHEYSPQMTGRAILKGKYISWSLGRVALRTDVGGSKSPGQTKKKEHQRKGHPSFWRQPPLKYIKTKS